LAEDDPPPGLIGYDAADRPVGWIALGPREAFAKLKRSPVMKPVDDQAVWSIVCFVVPSRHRGQGVARALLDHAIPYARGKGALILEAYPIDKRQRSQDQWLWHGTKSMFDRAGFHDVARRKPERPVMRLTLG
jgi:GNAT superfamily N-acetyltransferase